MAYRLDAVSWICFVWPIQCSENILISCQSHEISHKNVDFWLFLKSRKLWLHRPSLPPGNRGLLSLDEALFFHSLPCLLLSHTRVPCPIYNTSLAPLP